MVQMSHQGRIRGAQSAMIGVTITLWLSIRRAERQHVNCLSCQRSQIRNVNLEGHTYCC